MGINSSDKGITPPVEGGGFFRRLFKWRAVYRPDELRMSRWRWWVVLVFLPPIALYIVWKDKKFLKQMALAIFYFSTTLTLWYLFSSAYFTITTGYEPSWRFVLLPTLMHLIVLVTSSFFLAVYAQYAIIKTEKRIRDSSDSNPLNNNSKRNWGLSGKNLIAVRIICFLIIPTVIILSAVSLTIPIDDTPDIKDITTSENIALENKLGGCMLYIRGGQLTNDYSDCIKEYEEMVDKYKND